MWVVGTNQHDEVWDKTSPAPISHPPFPSLLTCFDHQKNTRPNKWDIDPKRNALSITKVPQHDNNNPHYIHRLSYHNEIQQIYIMLLFCGIGIGIGSWHGRGEDDDDDDNDNQQQHHHHHHDSKHNNTRLAK